MTALRIRRAAVAAGAAALAMMTAMPPAAADGSAGRRAFTDRTDSEFQRDCLAAVNAYRAKHQAPPLTVDPAVVDYAKSRAQQVSRPNGFNHDGLARGYGETLSRSSTAGEGTYTPDTCRDAVDAWYEGSAHYDYTKPGFSRETGSFTQLVWKSTTKLGCARVGGLRDGGPDSEGFSWSDTYIVCDFTPRGNLTTDPQNPTKAYRDNVLPPRP
ncbi:CAP family protein [Kitasatospora griseola]|uniref:CAP family protein n=1 Tax=Kitasatospora griseola TaxID=2064 RepID=UPI0036D940B6